MKNRFATTDKEANKILAAVPRESIEARHLLDIATETSKKHSFVENQTYPRPGHPKPEKRLSPLFTFAGVLTSLRCTLATETRVTNELIKQTEGLDRNLLQLGEVALQDILRPAGMANQKSKWIMEGVKELASNPSYAPNTLSRNKPEITRQRLLRLKGVGQKAVDCFMLLGLDMPVFPVDTNVFKLVTRNFPGIVGNNVEPQFTNPKHTETVKKFLEETFSGDAPSYQVLHTYLLLAEKHKINT